MWTSVTSPMRENASRTVSPVDENDKLPTYRRVPMSLSLLSLTASKCAPAALSNSSWLQPTVRIKPRPRWRNPPRQHVALPSIKIRGPDFERAVVAGETSVSTSKHNGPNCPRKLFAYTLRVAASDVARCRSALLTFQSVLSLEGSST